MKKSFLMNTIKTLEERIEELEGSCSKKENKESKDGTEVCIDFDGQVRMDKEEWKYPFNSEENKCVHCSCKVRCKNI